mgnify:CR=1 FL=1|jgi:hypothetical protein
MSDQSGTSAAPTAQQLEELKLKVARRQYGRFVGARMNWFRVIVGFVILALILGELYFVHIYRTEGVLLKLKVADLEAAVAAVQTKDEAQQQVAPVNAGLTQSDVESITKLIDDRVDPVRALAQQSLSEANSANATVQQILSEPPFVVTGKEAMLFTSKRFVSFDERLGRIEEAVWGSVETTEDYAPTDKVDEGAAADVLIETAQPEDAVHDG